MKINYTKEQREKAINQLKEVLDKAGRKVYCIIKSVSSSGMNRNIDFYCFTTNKDKTIGKHWLSYRIAGILDYPFNDKKETIKVNGCGMDMGFSVVYNLI